MTRESRYIKWARPTILYVGMAIFLLNLVVFPKLAVLAVFIDDPVLRSVVINALQPVQIPDAILATWGALAAWYVGGRTMEKRKQVDSTEVSP